MMFSAHRLTISTLIVAALTLVHARAQEPVHETTPIDFVRNVQPIFAEHCVRCHGPEKHKAGLRLDNSAAVTIGGDSGSVILPHDSAHSELILRVMGVDPEDRMPPKGDPLSPKQVAILGAWIDAGAAWPAEANSERKPKTDHWAFKTPARPDVPEVQHNDWVHNPIDNFVLSHLEAEGLTPSPEADKITLMRRLHMDLTGLPPTPDEVESYLNDTSPYAYENLVNRLLASPHFGERWGRHWLDLARYADSDGYEKDTVRPYAYRYRDWVIDALNRDMPYDQFVTEQLAGDLLPNATVEQKMATGFHRNTLTNREGGIDPEEDRSKIAIDRVNTTASTFLGLTMGCAQCHSHKYDPITQREYYGMYWFFNRTIEKDVSAPVPGEMEGYKRQKARYDAELARLKKAIADRRPELETTLAEWEASLDLPESGWQVLNPDSYASAGGASFKKLDDQSLLLQGFNPPTDSYTVVARIQDSGIKAIRLEALTHNDLTKTGPGRAYNGNLVLNEFRVYAAPTRDPNDRTRVKIKSASADFEEPGRTIDQAIDGDTGSGWAIYREMDMNENRTATFILDEEVGDPGGTILTFELDQRYGRQHTIGRVRLSVTKDDPGTLTIPDNVLAALKTPPDQRSGDRKNVVLDYYAQFEPASSGLIHTLSAVENAAPQPPATMAQTLAANPEPPKNFLFVRGDFLQKSDEVPAITPAVLNEFKPSRAEPDRLDLAHWIVDPQNPLTARVQANRVWQYLFGQGIVTTPEDFGTRCDPPSQPELLDWLATEYMARGWSTKDMVRLIVNSATYRQTSDVRPELEERDPTNRLLARQNRFRVEAEIVRDAALLVSGLLNKEIGGPSVRPPLPNGVADLGYAGSVQWPESPAPDKYRRGIYILFQRTVPYPMLMNFDCPDSNVSVSRRERSNSPLQALNLLNSPVFFDCAQSFGARIMAEGPADDEGRIRWAFQICTAREPNEAELTRLIQYVSEQRAMFESQSDAAVRFAVDASPETNPAHEVATWIAVARVLMNLDEFVTRE